MVALCGATLPAAAGDARAGTGACDWPMYAHDPARDGATRCDSAPSTSAVRTMLPRWFVHSTNVVTASPSVVDGIVYVGDWDGNFYALDLGDGHRHWATVIGRNRVGDHVDQHASGGYGQITSSALVATIDHRRTVFVGAGASLYALDASADGIPDSRRVLWRVDVDPQHPTSTGEVESSPLLYDDPVLGALVIFGADANQASTFAGEGVWAVHADGPSAGMPAWHLNPEQYAGKALYGCGNVWSSPALDLDPANPDPSRQAMVFFGMADCPDNTPSASIGPVGLPGGGGSVPCPADGSDPHCPPGSSYDYSQRWQPYSEAIVGADARTGRPVWSYQAHPPLNTADDDFGASAQVFTLPGGRRVVGEGNKDGSYYVVDRNTGSLVWKAVEVGNGNIEKSLAIGGFIGTPAIARVGGAPVVIGGSAVDTPVTFDPATGRPTPQADPTAGLTPMRAFSGAAPGTRRWQAAQAFTYGASSFANGVVYNGALDGFLRAYDATTGALLWLFPTSGPISSGPAVAGGTVVVGTGTTEGALDVRACDIVPQQLLGLCRAAPEDPNLDPLARLNGVWAFSPAVR